MKKATYEKLVNMKPAVIINNPNRKQGRRRASYPLCTCGQTKAVHFGGELGHSYKAGSQRNDLSVVKEGKKTQ